MEFSKTDFAANVAMIDDALRRSDDPDSLKIVRLGRPGTMDIMDVAAREGSFASMKLLQYLGNENAFRGTHEFIIGIDEHEIVKAFYAPLWEEQGHATIDFLRDPGVLVQLRVRDDGVRLKNTIEAYVADTATSGISKAAAEVAVLDALDLLDYGVYRVAEPDASSETGWRTNAWLKHAILLSFKLFGNQMIDGAPGCGPFYDKVPLKFAQWTESLFRYSGIRAVPGSNVRRGAYVAKGVVLMPSYVNIGAYVGEGSMVDTSATVGSCAQIGKGVHLSGGVGIGGVLEPAQANPTIIEDGAFIGARSEVVEGVIVRKRAVLSMGVFIGKNTPIVDRITNETYTGYVPENAVVMMGLHPSSNLICPQIIKYRDEKTDAATALNDALRG